MPILFGDGTRLTDALPAHVELEPAGHVPTPSTTHLRYRVKRSS